MTTAATARVLQRIVNNAQVHLPGAIEAVFKQELYNVCDEFFKTTNAWQELVPFTTIQDKRVYEVVPTVGIFVRLMEVKDGEDFPRAAVMDQDMFVVLRDSPTGGSNYMAALAVTCVDPTKRDGWPEVPVELLSKYYDAMTEGLLGRMMLQPAKPYSNPEIGTLHQRRFHNIMAIARTDVLHASTYNVQNWRFPRFA
jgi:hypothetical protein